jgi:hypothetical protein
VAVNNQQTGPFEMGLIAGKVKSGELKGDQLVWRQGMAQWTKAREVPELAGLFAGPPAPPPLPKG